MTSRTSTRRDFLRSASSAGAGLALMNTRLPRARAARLRPTVAVLGGGVAGLTAAHELAERGFDVTVYERKALGGKARSIPVPDTGDGGRRPLPGEHGYRICIGTYQYLPDTMRRIPLPAGGTVYDNLVDSGDFLLARDRGREDFHTFLIGPPQTPTPTELLPQIAGLLRFGADLPPDELALFTRKLAIYLTSCEERRFGEWERVSMWDYMEAGGKSEAYCTVMTGYLSHVIQSTPAKIASARAHMNLWEALVYCALGQGDDRRPFARLLNAPTNEAWIEPWVNHLLSLGVRFRVGDTVDRLHLQNRRIASATVCRPNGDRYVAHADWFVCAVPVERARRLLDRTVLAADPNLELVRQIPTRWMNGIQFFLREDVAINHGHVAYIDSPWVVSSISQAQFWTGRSFPRHYGDGQVRGCLSAIASEWQEPGILYRKAARDCTREQIAREVWAQMKAHLDDTGATVLPDGLLHSWFLDPAIRHRNGSTHSDEPLFIETPGLWDSRPTSTTAIQNLFLASDYVRNPSAIDAATMDGANAAARTAVNGLLDAAASPADRVPIFPRYTAPEYVTAKRLDAERYKRGEPHALDFKP
jgi:uncharacterized protein with NAD-binding domain and iron-sulfur cluster